MAKHTKPKHSQNVTRALEPSQPDGSPADPMKETALVYDTPVVKRMTPMTDADAQAIIDALPSSEEVEAAAGDPTKAAAMLDRIGAAIGLPPDEIASVVAKFAVPHLGDTVVIPGHHMGFRGADVHKPVVAIVIHVDEKAGLFEALAFGPSGYDVMRRVVVDAMKPGAWRHA